MDNNGMRWSLVNCYEPLLHIRWGWWSGNDMVPSAHKLDPTSFSKVVMVEDRAQQCSLARSEVVSKCFKDLPVSCNLPPVVGKHVGTPHIWLVTIHSFHWIFFSSESIWADLKPLNWASWRSPVRIDPVAWVSDRCWMPQGLRDAMVKNWSYEPTKKSFFFPVCVWNPLLILQGAVTEFVGSLPMKMPLFSGDALGDVLMCTCKWTRQAVLIRLFQVIDQVCKSIWFKPTSFPIYCPGWFLRHYTGDGYLDFLQFYIRVDSTLNSVKWAQSHWLVSAVCTLCVACTWLEPAFRCKVGYCNTSESWRDLVPVWIWL